MRKLLKRIWMTISHRPRLTSNDDTVMVHCSCGWLVRCDGDEKWSDAYHAWNNHIGIMECSVCKRYA
jgi:hypothetical protein